MDRIVIKGGRALEGEIPISGAKNACLPIMTATLLTDRTCTLRGVPELMDVRTMARLLAHLGVEVSPEMARAETVTFKDGNLSSVEAPYELVKTMRASVLVLGPLVARHRLARVSLPGGCAIGARPINLHLKGLEAMGARIELEEGYVVASAKRLQGADFTFDQVTVTGTENLVMAAVLAKGTTVLRNAAREPEVADLCRALIQMGAVIEGLDTDTLTIHGVDQLEGFDYRVMPDRIETGTYLAAAAITNSRLSLTGARPENLDAVTAKFREAGVILGGRSGPVGDRRPVRSPQRGGLRHSPLSRVPHGHAGPAHGGHVPGPGDLGDQGIHFREPVHARPGAGPVGGRHQGGTATGPWSEGWTICPGPRSWPRICGPRPV